MLYDLVRLVINRLVDAQHVNASRRPRYVRLFHRTGRCNTGPDRMVSYCQLLMRPPFDGDALSLSGGAWMAAMVLAG